MKPLTMIEPFCPIAWAGKPRPERRWLIPGLLIRGSVTLLSGDGGVGKSLLGQQLATAMATCSAFLGIAPHADPVPSLSLFCEDDLAELHYRQMHINAHYGCAMEDLGAMTLLSRVGEENGLMSFERYGDEGQVTPLYHQLEHFIRHNGTELIIVDTAADTFIGNENIRVQVRQFVAALRRLARINDGGVLLMAHPSLTGLASGSGLSGNTAWHNSVRGRLYLTRPATPNGLPNGPGESEEEQQQDDRRVLKLMKNNYGPLGEQLRLVWRDHVFALEEAPSANMVERLTLDNTVLAGLRKLVGNGALVPADPNAKTGMANKVRTLPSCRRWSWQTVFAAQERLIASGRIEKVELGPPSKRRVYVRPHDMRLSGEVDIGNAGA